MDFIKAEDGMPIEGAMVTESIDGARKKVEAHRLAQIAGK
jgi:preprotein translocase subunit SecA